MQSVRKSIVSGLLIALLAAAMSVTAFASSDDNSLYELGIITEGVTVTPEFAYDTWEYDVVVPAGTTELELEPVPSSELATVTDVSGKTLAEDGTSTVYITVQSGSGVDFTYTLHVTSAEGPAQTEPQTEPPTEPPTEPATEKQTEPVTEDSRYVKVDKNIIQDAENTITDLKQDIIEYRDTINLYTKIMYGLIALSVLLLFLVINLILKKRDLKAELKDYRSLGYSPSTRPSREAPDGQVPGPAGPTDYAAAAKGNGQPADLGYVQRYYSPDGQLDVRPMTSKKRNLPQYEEHKPPLQAVPAQMMDVPQPQAGSPAEPENTRAARKAAKQAAKLEKQAAKAEKAGIADPNVQPDVPGQTAAAGPDAKPQPQAPAPEKYEKPKKVEVNMIDL